MTNLKTGIPDPQLGSDQGCSTADYRSTWKMKDGIEVLIRPIRTEDEPLMIEFHRTLSQRTVYMRYFHAESLKYRTTHDRLMRVCFSDHDRDIVLVAVTPTDGAEPRIIGVGRLSKLRGQNEAEFALLVSDVFQGRGLGNELLRRLTEIASQGKLNRIEASILRENQEMQTVARQIGYTIQDTEDPSVVRAVRVLCS